jgi:hypothetical protein
MIFGSQTTEMFLLVHRLFKKLESTNSNCVNAKQFIVTNSQGQLIGTNPGNTIHHKQFTTSAVNFCGEFTTGKLRAGLFTANN